MDSGIRVVFLEVGDDLLLLVGYHKLCKELLVVLGPAADWQFGDDKGVVVNTFNSTSNEISLDVILWYFHDSISS